MTNSRKYTWHKVAESTAEVTRRGERQVMELKLLGKDICLIYAGGVLFACTATCPHAGGRLSEGYIDAAGTIVCPLHRYRFNLKNGLNTSGEGYHLKTYPVMENDDGVFIGIEIRP